MGPTPQTDWRRYSFLPVGPARWDDMDADEQAVPAEARQEGGLLRPAGVELGYLVKAGKRCKKCLAHCFYYSKVWKTMSSSQMMP